MEKKPTSHLVKALIISLIIIVIQIAANFAGAEMAQYGGYASYLVLIIGVIWACMNYGNQMNHQVTFGNVFSHGFKTTAVITLICIAFVFVFFMLFPEIKDKGLEMARQKMEEQGKLTEDQIDKFLEVSKKYFMLFAVGGTLFMYLVIGLIASLVGAGVTRKNPVTPFDNQA